MNEYLVVKYVHILAVAITIGGMFARQLVRGFAKRSDDIKTVASLTPVALRGGDHHPRHCGADGA